MSPELVFYDIVEPNDPILEPWRNLYENTFPPEEQVPFSNFVYRLSKQFATNARPLNLLALKDELDTFLGLAVYLEYPACKSVFLSYLAILPERQGLGLGGRFFQEIVRRSYYEHSNIDTVVFEVDRPDFVSSDKRIEAERRIAFYRRQGAKLLEGVDYLQKIDGQSAVPMHIMVHSLKRMNPEQGFEYAESTLRTATGLEKLTRNEMPLRLI